MDTIQLLATVTGLVIFVVSTVAIWNIHYPDTLIQRVGLVLTDLGALFVVHAAVLSRPLEGPMLWTLVGVSVFAVGTLVKRVRAHRLGKVVS